MIIHARDVVLTIDGQPITAHAVLGLDGDIGPFSVTFGLVDTEKLGRAIQPWCRRVARALLGAKHPKRKRRARLAKKIADSLGYVRPPRDAEQARRRSVSAVGQAIASGDPINSRVLAESGMLT